MVVMAIDHARDMLGAARFNPTDLTQTTPALFFTAGSLTCARLPSFFSPAPARSSPASRAVSFSRFLLTRGLWLIVIELTVVKLGWAFNFDPYQTVLQVIWAIGWSMIGSLRWCGCRCRSWDCSGPR